MELKGMKRLESRKLSGKCGMERNKDMWNGVQWTRRGGAGGSGNNGVE